MPYLGNEPAVAYTSTTKDSFSGDASTTDFTMSKSANVNAVRVVVENVVQNPTVAYTCSGTTLSFTSAPPTGTSNIYVVHLGPPAATVAPPSTINNPTTFTGGVTLKNETPEDTDGGRESIVTFQGTQSGSEISTLAQIQASHDATADDQKGDLIFRTNDGSDGASPTERLRIDSAGSIITASLGTDNVHLGEGAGAAIVSGAINNVAIGKNALTSMTTSDYNTAVGMNAATAVTTGQRNTALGYGALQTDTQGSRNVALGFNSLGTQNFTSATDTYNIGIGYDAGGAVTTGSLNTIIGGLAGDALSTGDSNTVVGQNALSSDTQGDLNTAIGISALQNQNFTSAGTDVYNTAVGAFAGHAITDGARNTIIGGLAGSNATSTEDSTLIGYYAGGNGTMTGHDNVCVGAYAGYNVTAGRNVLVGKFAGASNIYLTNGVANVLIGDSVRVNAAGMSNAIVMGELVTGTGNNAFTFGNGATDSNINFGATSITAPSDERYKEEIATSTAGLSFINDLRPVTFKWKKAKDVPSDHDAYVADGEEGCDNRVMLSTGETNHGFIAQEVKTAIDNHSEIKDGFKMWSEDYREDEEGKALADGRQRVAPSELVPILTKAIQELSVKNDALESENTAIKARLDALEAG